MSEAEEATEGEGAADASEERALSFEFKGDAREYFRVWIVNLCLTLLTLGIFSAWAKVRKKRYFYAHTLLDGSPFQYLGRPIPILKGRVVAALLVVGWYVALHLEPELGWKLGIAFLMLMPWIAVRSAAFNARYSAFRNMTFHFNGSYRGFVAALVGWLLLTAATCGLAFPWLRARFTRYMISRTSFGGVAGEFRREGGHLMGAYLSCWLWMGLTVGLAGAAFGTWAHGSNLRAMQQTVYVTYAAYFLTFLYLKARITNIVWSGTRLGGLRFESSLSFRQLLWIYASNSLAILATAGLLIPWAVIRTAKYRAAHFAVRTEEPLTEFQGSQSSTVRAAGSEVAEFFDLDIAL